MPERRLLNREGQHHIDVIMWDGTYHHFTPRVLSVLLDTNRVMKFKRTSGWVTIGVDPVRSRKQNGFNNPYQGPERRITH